MGRRGIDAGLYDLLECAVNANQRHLSATTRQHEQETTHGESKDEVPREVRQGQHPHRLQGPPLGESLQVKRTVRVVREQYASDPFITSFLLNILFTLVMLGLIGYVWWQG